MGQGEKADVPLHSSELLMIDGAIINLLPQILVTSNHPLSGSVFFILMVFCCC